MVEEMKEMAGALTAIGDRMDGPGDGYVVSLLARRLRDLATELDRRELAAILVRQNLKSVEE